MSDTLVLLSEIAGYLVVGLTWARTQAVRLQKMLNKAKEYRNNHPHYAPRDPWFTRKGADWGTDLKVGLGLHALFWPVSFLVRLIVNVLDFPAQPVGKHRAKADKLKGEAEEYKAARGAPGTTSDEKDLLDKLIDSLLQQAKDIGL